jgi:hypothetical protein
VRGQYRPRLSACSAGLDGFLHLTGHLHARPGDNRAGIHFPTFWRHARFSNMMTADNAKEKPAYRDFLTSLERRSPIPILKQAKAEYTNLQ